MELLSNINKIAFFLAVKNVALGCSVFVSLPSFHQTEICLTS